METPRYQPPVNNGLAIASVVLGILSLMTCGGLAIGPLLGIILAAVAFGQIARSNGRQTGNALAGVGLALNLVSFVMIPIMAGILFPVFAKAREKARQASCQSNEKQLALAALQYAQDYDEQYPRGGAPWTDLLDPYVYDTTVFECLADDNGPPSYHMAPALRGFPLAKLQMPANTVMLFESDDEKGIVWRHNEGANFGYADGHIKWLGQANNPTRAAPTEAGG